MSMYANKMLNIKTKDKKPIGLTAFASPLAKPSERIVPLWLPLSHGKLTMCCDKMQMRDTMRETMCEYGKSFSVAVTEMWVAD